MNRPTATAVIVAAGRGERFGHVAKILAPAGDKPLLLWSLLAADEARVVADIVIVAGSHTWGGIHHLVATYRGDGTPVRIVRGGTTRRESVAAGVAVVPEDRDVVLIHDAARPLVTPRLFERCAEAALTFGSAIAAAPMTDTLKMVEHGVIQRTLPRERIWGAQTPQAFRREVIVSAIHRAANLEGPFTDEASMLEALGEDVHIVEGPSTNIKVTHRADLDAVDALLRRGVRGDDRT